MYYCFGSLLKVLSFCSKNGVEACDMCRALMSCVSISEAKRINQKRSSAYMGCTENLPVIFSRSILINDQNGLYDRVKEFVLPLINPNYYIGLVKALQMIIGSSQINSEVPMWGITCKQLSEKKTVRIVPFIGCLLSFAVSNTVNKAGRESIGLITEEWIHSLNDQANKLTVRIPDFIGSEGKLELMIENEDFDTVFTEIANGELLGIAEPNCFKCFCLNYDYAGFSCDELSEFLLQNVGKYVYSRMEYQEMSENKKVIQTIAAKALRKLRSSEVDNRKSIGELLVFSFLEGALKAPKIMSAYDLENKSGFCSGIHLLTYSLDGDKKHHQFVFGCSGIEGDIFSGIDSAIEKLKSIKERDNMIELRKSLNKSFFKNSFDDETTNWLSALVAPIKKGEKPRVDNAFGVFIGFSHGYDPDENEGNFQSKLYEKIQEEIHAVSHYIGQKLVSNNLADSSIYFYFLPFNDAISDTDALIKKLME